MNNEWLPSMSILCLNQLNDYEDKLEKFKQKLYKKDYLINFFENEIKLLKLKIKNLNKKNDKLQKYINNKQKEEFNLNKQLSTHSFLKTKIETINKEINDKIYVTLKNNIQINEIKKNINNLKVLIDKRKIMIFNKSKNNYIFMKFIIL